MAAEDPEEVSLDETPPFIPELVASHDIAVRNFSQVIFPDIPDFFPPDADTKVSYILSEAIDPSSKDWIGLFRVGWASPRDYSTYVWASKPKSSDIEGKAQHVTFQAYQLPGDDNEFYQFCYVTKKGYVKGASTPFQFRVSNENDCLVEVEDETGMIILQTKSDALEEKISALNQEKASMEETIHDLNKVKLHLEAEMQKQLEERADIQNQCKSKEDENLALQSTLSAKNTEIEKLTESLTEAESKLSERKDQISLAEETIARLSAELKELQARIEETEVQQREAEEEHLRELNKREQRILECEEESRARMDQIKELSLVKEETLQASSMIKIEKEEALRASLKMKGEASAKMQRYQDERDLFKTQLTESEVARQNALLDLQSLEEQFLSAEKSKASLALAVSSKEEKIVELSKKLAELEKKYKHELNKCQDVLRNSLDRANALNAAKQLLAVELSETAATKDTLMIDINAVKQEKEKLNNELKESQATLHAVQCQLATVEEKLQSAELHLNDFEVFKQDQLKETEDMEREMHNQIVTLQKELEEANSALVQVAEEAALREPMPALREASPSRTEEGGAGSSQSSTLTTEAKSSSTEDFDVEDLKNQVKDLTTRLQMGAEAYKDKFIECHKLERKIKKLQYQQSKKASQSSPEPGSSETPSSSTKEQSDRPAGWGGKLEQFFKAISDPDANAQSVNLQQKIETLEKNFEIARSKHRRYKQLYKEERQKLAAFTGKSATREADLTFALNDAETQNCLLSDENAVLRIHLDELAATQPLTDDPPRDDVTDFMDCDDVQFEDAPGVPMYKPNQPPYRYKRSQDRRNSSDLSDSAEEYPLGQDGVRFAKFNMCPEASQQGQVRGGSPETVSVHIPRKSKVVLQQPIRSPPQLECFSRDQTKPKRSSSRVSPETRRRIVKSTKLKPKSNSGGSQ